jgi:uncharacterized DUF497 family protein
MTFTGLIFEFDPEKAATNLGKHGDPYDEAVTVFSDPLSSTLPDDQHSDKEYLFITVGMSSRRRLLFVVYTETVTGIRLIGARQATARERTQYEELP